MSPTIAARSSVTIADVRGRGTVSVDEAAALLGVGRQVAYAATRRGDLPVIRFGRRVVVPVPALLKMLGEAPDVR